MTDKQKMEFQELQVIFFNGMAEYPNDTDRMQKMFEIFYAWIDKQIDAGVSRVLGANSTLLRNGVIKGGKA